MTSTLNLSLGETLAVLAKLLEYPGPEFNENLDQAIETLKVSFKGASAKLLEFKKSIANSRLLELEELYTRTFDLAPLCIPYLSSHIYGDENFERGALMSNLSQRYQECNFETNGELPDHLALILRYTAYCQEEELSELIEYCLKKPLRSMSDTLKEAENPYYLLLQSAEAVIETARKGVLS
ncbi:MAG: molecular chaperone TorD family protein [Candidatus Obscuribacterales bacterium]|nr:molecular chaperone TorD family protein [Candidatus Obscuribacterales bacterium]